MPSEQERQIAELSESLLEAMVADLATSIAIAGHREVKLCRTPCHRCGTHCRGKAQLPPPSATTLAPPTHHSNGNKSRSSTPQFGGDGSGSGGQVKNGVVLLPCLYCGRQIASNRYAPHLAGCLGLAGGSRRTARATATGNGKSRMGSERSASLYLDNESDAGSDASGPTTLSTASASAAPPKTGRGPGRPPKNANGKRANSPATKPGNLKKTKNNTNNPHPLTQSATIPDSPLTPSLPLSAGSKGVPRPYAPSQTPQAPDAEGEEDAEGEDDVGFDDASGIGGYMDAEGEEDDEYMHSDNGSDGSEDVDDNGQEIDDDYA
ncbi:hypothetical protein HD553DRAFT_346326 [Filobasidium floriforme]|uniref:uncharacterized protein n=1 Tax=Filobasidium floriforme TaxID=5210 RepID=UPI001E8D2E77|nr:uncharacterized protein HD553DRAFT_346326 [Filobasidium floriforme]KAH8077946.1 hypothetical protein HD553DRAFT_346326 [Filobasidium floriforme]